MVERIDLPAFAGAFGRLVHDAGIPVTPERSARFATALSLAVPEDRSRLYWTARTVFVSGREQLEAFDSAFALVFDAIVDPAASRGDPDAPALQEPQPTNRPPARPQPEADELGGGGILPEGVEVRDGDGEENEASELMIRAASLQERLSERDFSALEPDELIALRDLMRRLALAPPLRRARR
jgi:uncharacterized protein